MKNPTIDEVYDVKETIRHLVSQFVEVRSVGFGLCSRGYHEVVVTLAEHLRDNNVLPNLVNGVPVRYQVVDTVRTMA